MEFKALVEKKMSKTCYNSSSNTFCLEGRSLEQNAQIEKGTLMRDDFLRGNSRIVSGSCKSRNGSCSHVHLKRCSGSKKNRVELSRKMALYRFLSIVTHRRCHSATVSRGKVEKWKSTTRKKAVFPFWAAIAKGTIEPSGALGEFDDFFVGDQLVLYINDHAARIIRRDFSVRVHLLRENFSGEIDCAYTSWRDAGEGRG